MNLEIHKPRLVERVNAQMRSGHFHDVDELLEKALDALERQAVRPAKQEEKSPNRRTGADLIAALQASPYRELDIEPLRLRLSTPVRDVTF